MTKSIRDRAWRRAQRDRVRAREPKFTACRRDWRWSLVEKNWKHMYFRRNKLPRAQRLGLLWPHPKRALETHMEDMES